MSVRLAPLIPPPRDVTNELILGVLFLDQGDSRKGPYLCSYLALALVPHTRKERPAMGLSRKDPRRPPTSSKGKVTGENEGFLRGKDLRPEFSLNYSWPSSV